MAHGKGIVHVEARATLELSEQEIGALDALTLYSTDSFIEFFYQHLGKSSLSPYEAGLRSLFKTIRSDISPLLKQAQNMRQDKP